MDLISRQDAIDALTEKVFHDLSDEFYGTMQVLNELPSAQRKGEWYNKNEGIWNVGMVMTCTECGESFYEMPIIDGEPTYNFCPNCGARMEE